MSTSSMTSEVQSKASAELHEEVERATAKLRNDAALIRTALDQLHHDEDEANKRYNGEVDRILTVMDSDLAIARAALAAERAESREALRKAIADAENAARGWLDDLRVQVELGRMEARDRWTATMEPLRAAVDDMSLVVGRISSDAASNLGDARDAARHAIRNLRTAAADVARAIVPGTDAT